MRLKITTSPPLPPLQAWYFLPDSALRPSTLRLEEGEPCTTVESLKQRLCSELKTLRDARISKENVALLLDGFELLDSSSADVLRDGDLLCIKQVVAVNGQMRSASKRNSTSPGPPPRKKAKVSATTRPHSPLKSQPAPARAKPSTLSSSSEDSSSGSTSTDSSSTSSSSDSDTDSGSESDMGSSSEAPSVRPSKAVKSATKLLPKAVNTQTLKKTQSANHVPPGQGSHATHNRNQRRRKKLAAQRASPANGTINTAPVTVGTANATPLGPKIPQHLTTNDNDNNIVDRSQSEERLSTRNGELMMMGLSNKNKRKGFKRSMATVQPSKIIFDDEAVDPSSSSQTSATPGPSTLKRKEASINALSTASSSRPEPTLSRRGSALNLPRLVPPSEKQELGLLPDRMFVTSIDVEEGMWQKKGGKKLQHSGKTDRYSEQAVYEDRSGTSYPKAKYGWVKGGQEHEDNIVLPYDEEGAAALVRGVEQAETRDRKDDLMIWAKAETEWDTLPVYRHGQTARLPPGSVVTWKALGLDPVTLCPGFIVHVARVTENTEDKIFVRFSQKPGQEHSSLLVPEEEVQEEEFSWTMLQSEGTEWRIVDLPVS